VFTDSPFVLAQAEAQHRGHAVIEQINADLIAGPLAHLPSGHFSANDAWLTCAAIAHNLTRAAGHLAAATYATAAEWRPVGVELLVPSSPPVVPIKVAGASACPRVPRRQLLEVSPVQHSPHCDGLHTGDQGIRRLRGLGRPAGSQGGFSEAG
jgi:hypothetical protein